VPRPVGAVEQLANHIGWGYGDYVREQVRCSKMSCRALKDFARIETVCPTIRSAALRRDRPTSSSKATLTRASAARRRPFGDHSDYYTLPGSYPVFHITAITHRKDAVYPATIVGIPPMEDFYIGGASVHRT
jgi:hypothetical protein